MSPCQLKPGGVKWTFAYTAKNDLDLEADPLGRQTTVTRPSGSATTYTYDARDLLTSITDALLNPTSYGYDDAGRLTSVTHTGPGGPLQSFSYTLDDSGNRTAVTSGGGTESYTLDALNRITNVVYPNGDTVSYTYDANGNRTAAGADTFIWDYADRLTSATVDGTAATYAYVGNNL